MSGIMSLRDPHRAGVFQPLATACVVVWVGMKPSGHACSSPTTWLCYPSLISQVLVATLTYSIPFFEGLRIGLGLGLGPDAQKEGS